MAEEIKWPFGAADVQTPDYAATLNLALLNNKTTVKVTLTDACTINAVADDELQAGAELVLEITADNVAGVTATLGSGFAGDNIVVADTEVARATFEYDGSQWLQTGLYPDPEAP
jgi:hypothetical protein